MGRKEGRGERGTYWLTRSMIAQFYSRRQREGSGCYQTMCCALIGKGVPLGANKDLKAATRGVPRYVGGAGGRWTERSALCFRGGIEGGAEETKSGLRVEAEGKQKGERQQQCRDRLL